MPLAKVGERESRLLSLADFEVNLQNAFSQKPVGSIWMTPCREKLAPWDLSFSALSSLCGNRHNLRLKAFCKTLTMRKKILWDNTEIKHSEERMSSIVRQQFSFPYNPIFDQTLYKMTYLENWGSGIRKIAYSCREAGVEEPTYDHRPTEANGRFLNRSRKYKPTLRDSSELNTAPLFRSEMSKCCCTMLQWSNDYFPCLETAQT